MKAKGGGSITPSFHTPQPSIIPRTRRTTEPKPNKYLPHQGAKQKQRGLKKPPEK